MKKQRKFTTLFSSEIDASDSNMGEYRQSIADCNDIMPEDVTDQDIYDSLYEDIDVDWDNILSDIDYYDRKYPNAKYLITGKLGLWDGPHPIEKTENSLRDAVEECCCNIRGDHWDEIREDQYGCIYVDVHHHDGDNQFVIHKIENKRKKNIRFTKEV